LGLTSFGSTEHLKSKIIDNKCFSTIMMISRPFGPLTFYLIFLLNKNYKIVFKRTKNRITNLNKQAREYIDNME